LSREVHLSTARSLHPRMLSDYIRPDILTLIGREDDWVMEGV
jgi:hypothetical protein